MYNQLSSWLQTMFTNTAVTSATLAFGF